jgi:hypothetical protein
MNEQWTIARHSWGKYRGKICGIIGPDGRWVVGNDDCPIEREEDGVLIAAAPELLKACQEILRALTSPTRELLDSTRREMEPCERLLKEVIEKATERK